MYEEKRGVDNKNCTRLRVFRCLCTSCKLTPNKYASLPKSTSVSFLKIIFGIMGCITVGYDVPTVIADTRKYLLYIWPLAAKYKETRSPLETHTQEAVFNEWANHIVFLVRAKHPLFLFHTVGAKVATQLLPKNPPLRCYHAVRPSFTSILASSPVIRRGPIHELCAPQSFDHTTLSSGYPLSNMAASLEDPGRYGGHYQHLFNNFAYKLNINWILRVAQEDTMSMVPRKPNTPSLGSGAPERGKLDLNRCPGGGNKITCILMALYVGLR